MRYKLLIAYDGTRFHGWQVQPNGISIQEEIQKALSLITREEVKLVGSGRTDAGVHALEQVAHFSVEQHLNLYRVHGSLNGLLPRDIRIMKLETVDESFHAQYSALGKVYRYHLYTDPVLSPFRKGYVWHLPFALDLGKMMLATKAMLGTHDFTSFANEAHSGVAAHDPVRTLQRIDLLQEPGGFALEFEGDGFLYMMVRNLVGTLVEVASGKRDPESIPALFEARDRRKAGQAAPPCGLFLVKVRYP